MNDPLVSVILPTYNRAHVLKRAMLSALDQSFKDFELVVVDDGSTDDTETVVQSITDPRVRFISLAHNVGVSEARNVGIDEARGKYVAFLDSDDEWDVDKLTAQVQRFEENPHHLEKLGLVFGVTVGRLSPAFVQLSEIGRQWNGWAADLIWKYPEHTWSTMLVARGYLKEIGGFDARLKASEFWDLSHRLVQVCQIDATNGSRSILHHEPGPRNWNRTNQAEAATILLKKHSFRGRYGRKAKAGFHTTLARHRAAEKDTLGAMSSMFKAVLAYPDPRFALTVTNLVARRVTGRDIRRNSS